MASEDVYFKGKGKWIRPNAPNEWGKWAMVLYPDQESLEKIRDLQAEGLKNVIKKDDDGYYLSITRPAQKIVKGRMVGFTPPKVLDKDGKDMSSVSIGNGSDVTVKVEKYDFTVPNTKQKAVAMRWEAVRVDNLVPFEEKKDFTDQEQDQVEGLAEQPEHIF